MGIKAITDDTRRRHQRRFSCITAEDAQQWQTAEVSLAEMAMRQEMQRMLSHESEKLYAKDATRICAVLQCEFAVTDVAVGGEKGRLQLRKMEGENQRLRETVHSLKMRVRRRDLTIERLQDQLESESSSDYGGSDSREEEYEDEEDEEVEEGSRKTAEDVGFFRKFFTSIACSAEDNYTSDAGDVSKSY